MNSNERIREGGRDKADGKKRTHFGWDGLGRGEGEETRKMQHLPPPHPISINSYLGFRREKGGGVSTVENKDLMRTAVKLAQGTFITRNNLPGGPSNPRLLGLFVRRIVDLL